MSGSGGGGYIPPQRSDFDCETGYIITNVSSIDITILKKLSAGDILEVKITANEALSIEDGNGEVLGSILHLNTPDILKCINAGAVYEVNILSINSPACRVRVQRANL